MKKVVSYILILVGAIITALSYPSLRAYLSLSIPVSLKDSYIMLIGVIILLIGAFLLYKGTSNKSVEVPIYEGQGKHRKIVGYQRHRQ